MDSPRGSAQSSSLEAWLGLGLDRDAGPLLGLIRGRVVMLDRGVGAAALFDGLPGHDRAGAATSRDTRDDLNKLYHLPLGSQQTNPSQII